MAQSHHRLGCRDPISFGFVGSDGLLQQADGNGRVAARDFGTAQDPEGPGALGVSLRSEIEGTVQEGACPGEVEASRPLPGQREEAQGGSFERGRLLALPGAGELEGRA